MLWMDGVPVHVSMRWAKGRELRVLSSATSGISEIPVVVDCSLTNTSFVTDDANNSNILQHSVVIMAALLFPFASAIAVPDGYVSLILLQEEDSSFYLQVPLNIIHSLCLKPRKYLRYLGWCILGVEGVLALRHGGSGIDTTGDLENQGIYYYVVDAGTGTLFPRPSLSSRAHVILMADYTVLRRSHPRC